MRTICDYGSFNKKENSNSQKSVKLYGWYLMRHFKEFMSSIWNSELNHEFLWRKNQIEIIDTTFEATWHSSQSAKFKVTHSNIKSVEFHSINFIGKKTWQMTNAIQISCWKYDFIVIIVLAIKIFPLKLTLFTTYQKLSFLFRFPLLLLVIYG